MSSSAYIKFDPGSIGIPVVEWKEFCAEHNIVHSPRTIGGNVFYAGQVEIWWNWLGTREELPTRDISKPAMSLAFSTFFQGSAVPDVARLACLSWQRWGGDLQAAPEVARHFQVAPMMLDRDGLLNAQGFILDPFCSSR